VLDTREVSLTFVGYITEIINYRIAAAISSLPLFASETFCNCDSKCEVAAAAQEIK
jgi:hypothetical protein